MKRRPRRLSLDQSPAAACYDACSKWISSLCATRGSCSASSTPTSRSTGSLSAPGLEATTQEGPAPPTDTRSRSPPATTARSARAARPASRAWQARARHRARGAALAGSRQAALLARPRRRVARSPRLPRVRSGHHRDRNDRPLVPRAHRARARQRLQGTRRRARVGARHRRRGRGRARSGAGRSLGTRPWGGAPCPMPSGSAVRPAAMYYHVLEFFETAQMQLHLRRAPARCRPHLAPREADVRARGRLRRRSLLAKALAMGGTCDVTLDPTLDHAQHLGAALRLAWTRRSRRARRRWRRSTGCRRCARRHRRLSYGRHRHPLELI